MHHLVTRGLPRLCCGRWLGLTRAALFGRKLLRLRRLVPGSSTPSTKPGVGAALNMEAIQQVLGQPESVDSFQCNARHI